MKKVYWILVIIGVILIAWIFVRFILGGSEDDWIKDEKGVYVKHGSPAETPDYVKEQKDAIACALQLYQQKKAEGMQFSSQCLGSCGNYAIDIVHVPRNEEDNLVENQCEDYREGKVSKFIEIDSEGNIFRIV